MTKNLRKLALTAHVTSSVGLLGSIAAFLMLAIVGLNGQSDQTIRAAYLSMDLIAYFLVVPLALAASITGCVQSAGTPWGFFKHYWVSAKIVLTGFATAVLLLKLRLISHAAQLAALPELPRTDLSLAGNELVLHASGGLAVLLIPVVLSVYKPRGLTPYGRRERQGQPIGSVRSFSDGQRPASASRRGVWVPSNDGTITITLKRGYAFGFVAFVLVAHVFAFHVAGTGHLGH